MKNDSISVALCGITKKYGGEGWFAGVTAYGRDRVVLYYKDKKNVPHGNGRFSKFAGVHVKWQKVA